MPSPKDYEILQDKIRGVLLGADHEEYDRARTIHNGMIDHHPALIARCHGAEDVVEVVNFARQHQILVSVLGGGHGVSGHAVCQGGLMIDLSRMKKIQVDPALRTARAEAGVTWGEFDSATQSVGMATTGGLVRTTGIAGLTLGGGYGFLMRKFGLSCDNLLSADVITPDSGRLTSSAGENPDLFWGLRGGGGNFGVVTSFEYQLHPVGPIYGGLVTYPIDQARRLLRHYDTFVATAPDDLGPLFVLGTLPDGTKVAILVLCYCGPADEGKRCLEPLLAGGTPLANRLSEMPYEAVQSIVENFNPRGMRNYWKSTYFNTVTDDAAEMMVDRFLTAPSPQTHLVLYTQGGAMARVKPEMTAVENRGSRHALLIVGMWDGMADDERNIAWVRRLFNDLECHSSGGFYANFDSDTNGDRVRLAYGPEKLARLRALKDKYDPANFFRLNQNIAPSAAYRAGS